MPFLQLRSRAIDHSNF